MADPWYDDDFASPSGALPDPSNGVHGPYSLQQITASSFSEVTPRQCGDALTEWLRGHGALPAQFTAKCDRALRDLLDSASAIYQLNDLGKAAEHQWGAHLATHGFLEFVIVSAATNTVAVLVASDD